MTTPNNPFYELNPDIRSLLTIETFRENVSTTDFIERISATVIDQMKDANGKPTTFDPKPFIRTFENVLEELQHLKTRVQEQCSELENSTQTAELEYKRNITDLHGAFDDVYRSYDSLESRIGDVGKTAIRIGEQLETIDKERSKASESRDIIEYFMEFQDGNTERLDSLRQGGEEGQLKTAIISRRLNAVAKDVDNDKEARMAIEKFCESFEKEILMEFDKAYEESDPRVMAHCAKVLFEFNGGASCVQLYVNQHEFFMSNMKIEEIDQVRDSEDNADLSNPNLLPPEVDTSLVKLYDDIRITVRREAGIISSVFPQPATVMQVLLQRIFAQSIQDHIELLLSRSKKYSRLAYLRTLASTHAETKRLIENLKFYCDKEVSLKDAADVNGLVTSASPDETLDRCMDDLFVPYTEGDRYIKKEIESLHKLFGNIVSDFLSAMQRRKMTSTRNQSVLTRTLNQISSSTSTGNILSPSVSSPAINEISNTPNPGTNPFEKTATREISSNIVTVDDSGFTLLSSDAIMRILNIHAEGVIRCVELEDSQELLSSLRKIYHVLVDFIGQKYLDIAMDETLDDLTNTKEPELACFSVIKSSTDIVQLMQNHFESAMLPLVISIPSTHRDLLTLKNTFMATLERKINIVLQKSIEGITYWLSEILSRQKKNDFRPKDEEGAMMSMGTQPCMQSVDFITRVYRAASQALQGKNFEAFLRRVGNAFHSMLLEHFKKFFVTPTGGLLVTKDIAKYQEVIRMFKLPGLDERFEMLRQLGNIFVVKPEILKSILSEGYLARLDPSVLYPYLEKRIDFKTAKLDRLLGITMDDTAGASSSADTNANQQESFKNTKGGKAKPQRRSLFVNDNEVLKDIMKNYTNNRDFLAAFNLS
ncbi:exocyst complex component Sec10-domain-containing protein [Mucor mucedo]|uniref:exocyst complex component Sec10-domain-containing protein n=1 Tax=Mucor mucedo TaxID=29922 RepID=UPI0022209930|nr:exocyst complex component Sec10-domain-containing protein [Mucor mucedo]KAI7890173.1 exocyst complex component Sec10-domain-containing protein [Mucor mucedo]